MGFIMTRIGKLLEWLLYSWLKPLPPRHHTLRVKHMNAVLTWSASPAPTSTNTPSAGLANGSPVGTPQVVPQSADADKAGYSADFAAGTGAGPPPAIPSAAPSSRSTP